MAHHISTNDHRLERRRKKKDHRSLTDTTTPRGGRRENNGRSISPESIPAGDGDAPPRRIQLRRPRSGALLLRRGPRQLVSVPRRAVGEASSGVPRHRRLGGSLPTGTSSGVVLLLQLDDAIA
ncbi:hypothetical protein ZWY2020_051840 [Hordeum vulgare]|nr:hypothetical protein ZWY2020_051840 [Hordeum vulgare]